MYDIIKSKPVAITISALLTAFWLEIYLYFIFPPNHMYTIASGLWLFGNGSAIDHNIVTQFIIGQKIQQIAALTFFDCVLLYFIKRKKMPGWWLGSLVVTSFFIGGIVCYITASLPRIEDDLKFIEYILLHKTIVHMLQLFFLFMILNKISVYLPGFIRIADPPRTEG